MVKNCTKCLTEKDLSEYRVISVRKKKYYRGDCKSCEASYAKIYHQSAKWKQYKKTGGAKEIQKNHKRTDNWKKYAYNYIKRRRLEDPCFKLSLQLRSRLYSALKGNIRNGSAIKDLGCSLEELKVHIEKQFKPGMTWENWKHDGWHIDHIRPLASFNLSERNQLLEACNFKNLQPLWAQENHTKSDKY